MQTPSPPRGKRGDPTESCAKPAAGTARSAIHPLEVPKKKLRQLLALTDVGCAVCGDLAVCIYINCKLCRGCAEAFGFLLA